MSKVTAVRGMPVIPPPAAARRREIENTLINLVIAYGYEEMRPPLLEQAALFRRAVGTATDIVEKEMYEFADKKGVSICLRPEATAGLMRGGIELGLFTQARKIWYLGEMFRYERPQSGRQRQFSQLDLESVGEPSPASDAELLQLTKLFWQELGLSLKLQLNALGNQEARAAYSAALRDYLRKNFSELDPDSQHRFETAPLRILDSKNPNTQQLLAQAPSIEAYWDATTNQHFSELCRLLEDLAIPYQVNPQLVRGLDYYDKMVFEWVSDDLGAQNTVCAGGRYDGLISQLGGKATPAVGFALGLERLFLLVAAAAATPAQNEQRLVLLLSLGCDAETLSLLSSLQAAKIPKISYDCNYGTRPLKAKLRLAAKRQAAQVIILGSREVQQQQAILRDLRTSSQELVNWPDLPAKLAAGN